jgi:hypothetical protein
LLIASDINWFWNELFSSTRFFRARNQPGLGSDTEAVGVGGVGGVGWRGVGGTVAYVRLEIYIMHETGLMNTVRCSLISIDIHNGFGSVCVYSVLR